MRQVVAQTVCVGYRIRKCTVVLLTVVICRCQCLNAAYQSDTYGAIGNFLNIQSFLKRKYGKERLGFAV